MSDEKSICSEENNNPIGVGTRMKEDSARIAVLNYLQNAPMGRHDERHFFGFTFGLDTLKKFMDDIDKHNNKSTVPANEKIEGVRIYYGKTIRENPNLPEQKGVMLPDLIFVPVMPNGKDYYTKVLPEKLNDDDMILGESRPCPNQCKLEFLKKEEKKQA